METRRNFRSIASLILFFLFVLKLQAMDYTVDLSNSVVEVYDFEIVDIDGSNLAKIGDNFFKVQAGTNYTIKIDKTDLEDKLKDAVSAAGLDPTNFSITSFVGAKATIYWLVLPNEHQEKNFVDLGTEFSINYTPIFSSEFILNPSDTASEFMLIEITYNWKYTDGTATYMGTSTSSSVLKFSVDDKTPPLGVVLKFTSSNILAGKRFGKSYEKLEVTIWDDNIALLKNSSKLENFIKDSSFLIIGYPFMPFTDVKTNVPDDYKLFYEFTGEYPKLYDLHYNTPFLYVWIPIPLAELGNITFVSSDVTFGSTAKVKYKFTIDFNKLANWFDTKFLTFLNNEGSSFIGDNKLLELIKTNYQQFCKWPPILPSSNLNILFSFITVDPAGNVIVPDDSVLTITNNANAQEILNNFVPRFLNTIASTVGKSVGQLLISKAQILADSSVIKDKVGPLEYIMMRNEKTGTNIIFPQVKFLSYPNIFGSEFGSSKDRAYYKIAYNLSDWVITYDTTSLTEFEKQLKKIIGDDELIKLKKALNVEKGVRLDFSAFAFDNFYITSFNNWGIKADGVFDNNINKYRYLGWKVEGMANTKDPYNPTYDTYKVIFRKKGIFNIILETKDLNYNKRRLILRFKVSDVGFSINNLGR